MSLNVTLFPLYSVSDTLIIIWTCIMIKLGPNYNMPPLYMMLGIWQIL